MRRPPVALALPLLAALSLAGCGSNAKSGPTTVPPPSDVVITAVEGIRWDEDAYTATSHEGKLVIQGRNESSLGHNLYVVAADGTAVAEHEDLGKKGDSVTETFDIGPGSYTVICKIPGHSAMKSTLTVS
ncbi:MAG: plastocyanin/azurin family copper-binding protein [Ilumatobacteraceae bacterium]